MDEGLLVTRDVGLRGHDLTELLRCLLPLLGALLDGRRRHEPLEQGVENPAQPKDRCEQHLEHPDQRREREGEARCGGEAKRARNALHENDHPECDGEGQCGAGYPIPALDAERLRQRRTREQVREHARQRQGAMGALPAAQRSHHRRRWFGFGVTPDERPVRRCGESRDEDCTRGDAKRRGVHAGIRTRRSSCSWRRHIGDA